VGCHPHRGSTLRLATPPGPKPRRRRYLSAVSWQTRASGHVSCHAAHGLGLTPSRVFPSRKAPTPLGATCSLAVLQPRPALRCSRPYHQSFHRRPRSRALAWLPDRLKAPFPAGSKPPTFPVTLGHEHRDQLGSQPSPTAKLCSSRESVHASPRFPENPRPILSWAFRPSEAFS